MQFLSTPETVNLALWTLWALSWLIAALWRDRAVKRPTGANQILYRLLAVGGFYLLFARAPRLSLPLWHTPLALQWATIPIITFGFAFSWWARLHLGRLWSSSVSRKADHHVVDTGPYGIVRHPIYTGLIIASTAMAVMRGTIGAWGGMAAMTCGWYVKARMEERFLREELGADAYGAYTRRVPMLIPFVG